MSPTPPSHSSRGSTDRPSRTGCPTSKESFSLRANVLHLRAPAQCRRRHPPTAPEDQQTDPAGQAVRPARRASVYVPTFFTSEPQPNVADATLPQLQRINRQTQQVELPLYYNAYRAPNQQVVYQ